MSPGSPADCLPLHQRYSDKDVEGREEVQESLARLAGEERENNHEAPERDGNQVCYLVSVPQIPHSHFLDSSLVLKI